MTNPSFDDMVLASVYETLVGRLGGDAWKQVGFYFDLRNVAGHPEAFSRLLDGLFGKTSQDLQTSIVKTLLGLIGGPMPPILEGTRLDDWYGGNLKPQVHMFQDWIRRARERYTASNGPLGQSRL